MKVLLLGSSGWVAHYLIPELQKHGVEVLGISNKNNPKHKIQNINIGIEGRPFLDEVEKIKCDFMINMLHSSDYKRSKIINEELSNYCIDNGIHYTFMSSSNALDGNPSRPHEEIELANGESDYGKYKAECEEYLYKNNHSACMIRFPATHGFAPNRLARTEAFLQKLKKGEVVPVARGVYQNRPFVGHLAQMICRVILDRHSGVFHLGTKEQSDEYDFLKRVAAAFGHNEDRLSKGEQYDFHMTVYPKRIYELYGNDYLFSEQDTIDKLSECLYLAKYKFC